MAKVIIVGGGAAGMFASIWAARAGHQVHVFERNEKLGKKVYITGKGRCNVTNAGSMEEIFDSVVSNPKFLYSAFYGYTNTDFMDFMESLGVKLKIERGNRVFPQSDRASTIILALEKEMKRLDVKIHLKSKVKSLLTKDNVIKGVLLENDNKVEGDAVLVATGGMSYPTTGSTGDGYEFAKSCDLKVTSIIPSLVPLVTKETYITDLQGLSLKNVTLSIFNGKKKLYEDFGEMMFTHFGITGPIVLSASARVGKAIEKNHVQGYIDLKPALSIEQLDTRILRMFDEAKNKQFKNVIGGLFPARLEPIMVMLSKISPEKKVNEISREERMAFVQVIKKMPFTIVGLREMKEAIITKGGVSVKEVNPSTMESKKVAGLYFIGEVLDLDAVTGGYNLQIAWSTAFAAGSNIGGTNGL